MEINNLFGTTTAGLLSLIKTTDGTLVDSISLQFGAISSNINAGTFSEIIEEMINVDELLNISKVTE